MVQFDKKQSFDLTSIFDEHLKMKEKMDGREKENMVKEYLAEEDLDRALVEQFFESKRPKSEVLSRMLIEIFDYTEQEANELRVLEKWRTLKYLSLQKSIDKKYILRELQSY